MCKDFFQFDAELDPPNDDEPMVEGMRWYKCNGFVNDIIVLLMK